MKNGIVTVGNWLVDYVKVIEKYPTPGNLTTIKSLEVGLGGCAHNVAMNLAKMKTGIPIFAVGCIGDDANGEYIMREIKANNIDATYMNVMKDVATSYTDVMIEKGGTSRTYFHYRGANAKLDIEHVEKIDVPACIVHLGYLLLLDQLDKEDPIYGVRAARLLKRLKDKGYQTSVDVVSEESERFQKVIKPCLPYIDYLIINEVEAEKITGLEIRYGKYMNVLNLRRAADQLLDGGVNRQVTIHYPEGGYTLCLDGSSYEEPSFKIKPEEIVSTVGAGDAFCAGMLYALHECYDPRQSLLLANAAARFSLLSATCTGGMIPMADIKRFIERERWQQQIRFL